MVLAMVLAAAQPVWAGGELAEREIRWFLKPFPPVTILEGPLPGRGLVADFLRTLADRMPEYRHRYEPSGGARALGLMAQGEPACYPSLLKSPAREAVLVFSRPMAVSLPHHVVVRVDRVDRMLQYITPLGTIDVVRLLADGTLATTLTEQRVFPPQIAGPLHALTDQPHVNRANGDFSAPYRQLAAGWIDYLFAFPSEVTWQIGQINPAFESDVAYLPIDGMPPFLTIHTGCTKGPWGREVIARIDAVLRAIGPRPPWVDRHLALVDPPLARQLEAVLSRHQPLGHKPDE